MILHEPFQISARLLPAIKVGKVTISIEADGKTSDGRIRWKYYLDGKDWEYENNDLKSGVGGGSLQDAFASLLSFLSACGESIAYGRRSGTPGDNANLFPPHVGEWADQYSDELSMLECELEENPELITD